MRRLILATGFALLSLAAQALDITERTTASGVRYVQALLPDAQVQTLQLYWKDGAPIAADGNPGLAIAAPYLLGRGPKGIGFGELVETFRDLQASYSFFLATDASGATLTAPPEYMPEASAIFRRMLLDPALPQDRLDTYRRDFRFRVTQALRQGESLASQLRVRALLPPGKLRDHHLASPQKLDGLTSGDVDSWRVRTVTRSGLSIVTAGPMAAASIEPLIDALHAQLPSGTEIVRPAIPALALPHSDVMLVRDVPQTILQAFAPIAIGAELEGLKATFAIQRLGGGSQGRLHAALRDRLGASYGAQVSVDGLHPERHAVVIRTAVAHDKAADAVVALRAVYTDWWQNGLTEAEFNAIRSGWQGQRRDQRKQAVAVAGQIGAAIMRGLPVQYYAAADAMIDSMSLSDINAYIRAKFPRELAIVAVSPLATVLPSACVIQQVSEAASCGIEP